MKIWSRTGVLRITSTYAVATNRIARNRDRRASAPTVPRRNANPNPRTDIDDGQPQRVEPLRPVAQNGGPGGEHRGSRPIG